MAGGNSAAECSGLNLGDLACLDPGDIGLGAIIALAPILFRFWVKLLKGETWRKRVGRWVYDASWSSTYVGLLEWLLLRLQRFFGNPWSARSFHMCFRLAIIYSLAYLPFSILLDRTTGASEKSIVAGVLLAFGTITFLITRSVYRRYLWPRQRSDNRGRRISREEGDELAGLATTKAVAAATAVAVPVAGTGAVGIGLDPIVAIAVALAVTVDGSAAGGTSAVAAVQGTVLGAILGAAVIGVTKFLFVSGAEFSALTKLSVLDSKTATVTVGSVLIATYFLVYRSKFETTIGTAIVGGVTILIVFGPLDMLDVGLGFFAASGGVGFAVLVASFYLFAIPSLNTLLDWPSWAVSRWLMGRLCTDANRPDFFRRTGALLAHLLLDFAFAIACLFSLAIVLINLVHFMNLPELWNNTFSAARDGPFSARGSPMTVMLLSTLVPTALHLFFALFALAAIRPPKREWFAAWLEEAEGGGEWGNRAIVSAYLTCWMVFALAVLWVAAVSLLYGLDWLWLRLGWGLETDAYPFWASIFRAAEFFVIF